MICVSYADVLKSSSKKFKWMVDFDKRKGEENALNGSLINLQYIWKIKKKFKSTLKYKLSEIL